MRCGELCKSCVGRCREVVREDQPIEIECPVCDGDGCEHCEDGTFRVTQCPSRYIGRSLISDIHVAMSSDYLLPISGGILDQSAWWFELRETVKREESRIQDEQSKRRLR